MKSIAIFSFGMLAMACSGAKAPDSHPTSALPKAIGVPDECAEPVEILRAPNEKIEELSKSDPPLPNEWRRGTGDDHLRIDDGTRTYTMSMMGAISVTEKELTLWTVPEMPVAGGGFDLMLSPKGSFVVRLYSRGGLELFDAKNGHRLQTIGTGVPSPDDSFVIDLPTIPFGLSEWNHRDVRFVPMDPSKPARRLVELPLQNSVYPAFGAAICRTGTIFAISFPTTELAVYRTSNLQKLASIENPGEGKPEFTRSGRQILLRYEGKPSALFELTH